MINSDCGGHLVIGIDGTEPQDLPFGSNIAPQNPSIQFAILVSHPEGSS